MEVINYDGIITTKLFACTITSRVKYISLLDFRNALYKFLTDIEYKYAIKGFQEYHNYKTTADKVHMHGIVYYGNPPKNNKHNPFTFRISSLATPHVWDNYCKKEIFSTLQKHHDIQTGLFYWHQEPYLLMMGEHVPLGEEEKK